MHFYEVLGLVFSHVDGKEKDDWMENEPRWVLLKTVTAVFESEMIIALLDEAGIPSMVKGLEVGVWGYGWGGPVPRGVSIHVPSDRMDEAMQLLDSLGGDVEEQ